MKILGMGWPELLIILAVILIIFGPKNLPKLGNAIGKGIKSLRKGMNDGEEEKKEGEAAAEAAPVTAAPEPQPAPAPATYTEPAPAPAPAAEAPKTVKRVVKKAADTTAE